MQAQKPHRSEPGDDPLVMMRIIPFGRWNAPLSHVVSDLGHQKRYHVLPPPLDHLVELPISGNDV